jgi:hypothetical protein
LSGCHKDGRKDGVFHVVERLHEPVSSWDFAYVPGAPLRTNQDVFWWLLAPIAWKVPSHRFEDMKGERELLQVIATLS